MSVDDTPATAPRAPGDTAMRAVVRTAYGPVDTLRVARLPRPVAGKGEVLVRVGAAGVDRGVWHVMTGLPYAGRLAFGLRRPKQPVLGMDLAGTVVAVGPGVTGVAVGDEVYGEGSGTFAEYALAPARRLARRPRSLTVAQAGALAISGVTALKAVRDVGRVRAGQHVLITGASGGVGSYAVQLAAHAGARVTGVASAAKADYVRSLGAERALDYRGDDFADGTQRYDVIIDIAGNPSISRLRRALTPTGTAVITGGEDAGNIIGVRRMLGARLVSPFLRQRLVGFYGAVQTATLDDLTALVESGALTPSLDRTYPLDQGPAAVAAMVAGDVRGKLVITV